MILIVLPDVSNDDDLLFRAQRLEKDAIRVIYERYFPPIYQFIRMRINNREQARDIAADVFVDFMLALRGSHPPNRNLRAWLFRVARNKVYQQYGNQKQFPLTTLEEWTPIDSIDGPESAIIDRMQIERVRQVISSLVEEQQEVIILRFGQGLSLQETADLMGKSSSAIKSLQFRAIQNLRDMMAIGEKE